MVHHHTIWENPLLSKKHYPVYLQRFLHKNHYRISLQGIWHKYSPMGYKISYKNFLYPHRDFINQLSLVSAITHFSHICATSCGTCTFTLFQSADLGFSEKCAPSCPTFFNQNQPQDTYQIFFPNHFAVS